MFTNVYKRFDGILLGFIMFYDDAELVLSKHFCFYPVLFDFKADFTASYYVLLRSVLAKDPVYKRCSFPPFALCLLYFPLSSDFPSSSLRDNYIYS